MNFEELLKENHLKVTPQRMAILQEIYKAGHINIEDIYENIKTLYPSMSLATIYKNLTSMQEANIVRELKVPNQKQKYELCRHP
ncbi:MAG: Fur family transcriptional regulator, partial [Wolinella sp.]